MTGYRYDTGGCPQVTYIGDTVTIVETANPEQVVVTPRASWEAYLDTVRAQERAAIVAAIRADHAKHPWSSHGQRHVADMIERREFETPVPVVEHAGPGCACGINGAGDRFIDPICVKRADDSAAGDE